MKLDIDCVRDILLSVEENTGLHKSCRFIDEYLMNKSCAAMDVEPEEIPAYQASLQERHSNNKLIYHVNYCVKAGLIEAADDHEGFAVLVSDLSFSGHELLENIRSHGNWEKIKAILSALGSFSIGTLQQAAADFVASGTMGR